MKQIIIALPLTLFAPGLAFASDIPRYDPESWCEEVASMGGGMSHTLKGACLQQEQTAYDHLKPQWADIPAATRSWCDEVARTGATGTYVLLKSCIQQELESRKANSQSKFKF